MFFIFFAMSSAISVMLIVLLVRGQRIEDSVAAMTEELMGELDRFRYNMENTERIKSYQLNRVEDLIKKCFESSTQAQDKKK